MKKLSLFLTRFLFRVWNSRRRSWSVWVGCLGLVRFGCGLVVMLVVVGEGSWMMGGEWVVEEGDCCSFRWFCVLDARC